MEGSKSLEMRFRNGSDRACLCELGLGWGPRHRTKEKGKEREQPVSNTAPPLPRSNTYQVKTLKDEQMAVGERDGPAFGFGHAGKLNKW